MAPMSLWDADPDTYFSIGALWDEDEHSMPQAVGCLIFRVSYELLNKKLQQTSVLEWLFVEEDYRGNGIASKLLDEWKQITVRSKLTDACCRINMAQTALLHCLEHNGFEPEVKKWEICRMTLAELYGNLRHRRALHYVIRSLRETKEPAFRKAMSAILRKHSVLEKNGGLVPLSTVYDPDLSCATMENGQIRTLLLIQKRSEQELRVVVFRSLVPDAQKELLALLQTAVAKAVEGFPEDTRIEFLCTDSRMKMVVACLSSDYEIYEEWREWWRPDALAEVEEDPLWEWQMRRPENFFHPDLTVISARFQAVADAMTNSGYAFVLEYPLGGLPSLKVFVPDIDKQLEFLYETMWRDEELVGFTLYALSPEPMPDAWQANGQYVIRAWEEPLELDAQEVAGKIIEVVEEVSVWMRLL